MECENKMLKKKSPFNKRTEKKPRSRRRSVDGKSTFATSRAYRLHSRFIDIFNDIASRCLYGARARVSFPAEDTQHENKKRLYIRLHRFGLMRIIESRPAGNEIIIILRCRRRVQSHRRGNLEPRHTKTVLKTRCDVIFTHEVRLPKQ